MPFHSNARKAVWIAVGCESDAEAVARADVGAREPDGAARDQEARAVVADELVVLEECLAHRVRDGHAVAHGDTQRRRPGDQRQRRAAGVDELIVLKEGHGGARGRAEADRGVVADHRVREATHGRSVLREHPRTAIRKDAEALRVEAPAHTIDVGNVRVGARVAVDEEPHAVVGEQLGLVPRQEF